MTTRISWSDKEFGSLRASMTEAAGYLDACDQGLTHVRLNAGYYQCCARLLSTVLGDGSAAVTFGDLLRKSPAAREIAENAAMAHRLELSRRGFYPQLAAVLRRIAA